MFSFKYVSKPFDKRYGIARSDGEISEELVLDSAGVFTVIASVSRGLVVLWDGATRVYIRIEPEHRSKMQGLCGNYNSLMADEFMSQQGSIEKTTNEFADSWRVSTQCPPTQELTFTAPCELNPERFPWAQRACHVIQGDLFGPCHSVLDPLKFYQRCVQDSCACDGGGD